MSARCMAHGTERCDDCGRISAEYLIEGEGACRGCEHWGETGMHWDTCAGRIRGPVTAGCPVHFGMACPDGCPLTEKASVDMVAHPPHYESHPSGVQPITITRHETFCLGNVIKYCMRAKYKGDEIQDLRKAAQYLAWEIERLEQVTS